MIILKAEEKKDAEEWKKSEEELIDALAEQKKINEEMVKAELTAGGMGTSLASVGLAAKEGAEKVWAARKKYTEHLKRVDKLAGTVLQFRAQLMKKEKPEPEPEKKGWLSSITSMFSKEKKKKKPSTVAEEAIQQAEALAKAAEEVLKKMNKSYEKRTGKKAKGADALLEGKAVVLAKKEAEAEMEEILTKARAALQEVRTEGKVKREAALKKKKAAEAKYSVYGAGCTGPTWASAEKKKESEDAIRAATREYLAEIKALDEAEKKAEQLMDEVQKKVDAKKEEIKERIRAENASQQVQDAQAVLDQAQRRKEEAEAEIRKAEQELKRAEEKKQRIDQAKPKRIAVN